jgi:ammonium transporter, Amt family
MFFGNLDNFMFRGLLECKEEHFPDLLFALFQGMFAAFTPALLVGAAGERGRMLPCMIFVFCWATLVYDPIASWTWNSQGWARQMGVLDFAGGTPVHISSGAAALAYSFFLGKRKRETEVLWLYETSPDSTSRITRLTLR